MFIKSISCEIFERGFTPSEQRKSLHPSLPRLARDSGDCFGWWYAHVFYNISMWKNSLLC